MANLKYTTANLLLIVLVACSSQILLAQEANDTNDRLSQFSHLIGGEWHFGDSYQTFEWGLGKESVKAKSYAINDGKPKLVSEGLWLWHPGEKKLKGYFTAIEMPFVFVDCTTSFQGNEMSNELLSYAANGTVENYIETLEFTDDDHYSWTLFMKTAEGEEKIMNGEFIRKYGGE